ncbi:pyrroline-5-carboxylate reductase [Ensifer sp. Root127]|uniref:pyrroline-5-carboxylate reductase n=1 Tax=Ensifer sp. Root127 TaxID=1736440 RepID=UPI0007110A8D|nr:pyrroline-5-carboxylate reductase [Ensifer sp. Root127]KQW72467.1 pyrroline-5-carboxylate reductase [Ensifer sp. Root127]
MTHVLLVGAGNMGFAMLRSWVTLGNHRFTVVESNEALRKRAEELGVVACSPTDDLPADKEIDILVIATKPQIVGEAVARYLPKLAANGLIISVAAGVNIKAIMSRGEKPVAVIRSMPNTPAAIGEGMIVCCPSPEADIPMHRQTAEQLLSAVGRVAFVHDEALMDAVTAVSGSGPAYVFHFIEALSAAGVEAGLDESLALLLAQQTVFGAAKLALEANETPSILREQVTSPNGTTAAALEILMDRDMGLRPLLGKAVHEAKERSIELGHASANG